MLFTLSGCGVHYVCTVAFLYSYSKRLEKYWTTTFLRLKRNRMKMFMWLRVTRLRKLIYLQVIVPLLLESLHFSAITSKFCGPLLTKSSDCVPRVSPSRGNVYRCWLQNFRWSCSWQWSLKRTVILLTRHAPPTHTHTCPENDPLECTTCPCKVQNALFLSTISVH